jgi:hypothetical protein
MGVWEPGKGLRNKSAWANTGAKVTFFTTYRCESPQPDSVIR